MGTFWDRFVAEFERIDDLPTLHPVALELEYTLQADHTDADDVAEIMAEDPSLTANVLKLVNSVYYGSASGTIDSVQEAVARLGFDEVSRVITTLAVIQAFDDVGPHLDHKQFWTHNLKTAFAARAIRRFSDSIKADTENEAYLAGLLHDVGSLLLDQYFPKTFCDVFVAAAHNRCSNEEVERRMLDTDHGQIGGYLLDRWNLPKPIVQAVWWHHMPNRSEPDYRFLSDVIHAADDIVRQTELAPEEETSVELSAALLQNVGLRAEQLPNIVETVTVEAERSPILLCLGC